MSGSVPKSSRFRRKFGMGGIITLRLIPLTVSENASLQSPLDDNWGQNQLVFVARFKIVGQSVETRNDLRRGTTLTNQRRKYRSGNED
jgi:hypothetical protein